MSKEVNYTEMSDEDLKNRVENLRSELLIGAQKARLAQLKKTSELPRIRKEIARCLTFLKARELKKTA